MLLKIVTDEELLTSQIVKTILLILLSAGIIYNLFRIFKSESKLNRIINSAILALLCVAIILVFKEFREEASLLKQPKFAKGITTEYCSVFARGAGIEFEYEVNGITYRNCNTYHPIGKDQIIVPGGYYIVRYSNDYPEKGRMDFKQTAP
jgi:hypothetical protein